MKITEEFILKILKKDFPECFQNIYDNSLLLQYLDKKNESSTRQR